MSKVKGTSRQAQTDAAKRNRKQHSQSKKYLKQKYQNKELDGFYTLSYVDKSLPLEEYWHKILLDEDGNIGVVKRRWRGRLVQSKNKTFGCFGGNTQSKYDVLNKPSYTYRYTDVEYLEAYIVPLSCEGFKETGKMIIIGELA